MADRSPFSITDFRYYWVARLASTVAQMSMVIVIGWQVYDTARRMGMGIEAASLQLGFIGLVQFVPLFLLTLVTGWTADRVDRRYIARASIALELACAATLGWITYRHAVSLPWLFSIAALLGVARAFAGPALGALAPNLVPRSILPKAIALSSMAWQSGSIAGPAVGGYLYAWAPHMPYAVASGLFAVSLTCMILIRPIARTTMDASRNPWQQMIDGLHYVRRNRLVLGAISLDLFAVLLGGATALLPIFARDILQIGPQGLGLLRAAPAAGAVIVGVVLARRGIQRHAGVWLLGAVAVFGAATIGFGLSRSLPLAFVMLAISGAADMFSVVIRQSLVQLDTPEDMRGRVGAVNSVFIGASNQLGEFESGAVAALIGPVGSVLFGGVGTILVVLAWWRLFPALAKRDRLRSD